MPYVSSMTRPVLPLAALLAAWPALAPAADLPPGLVEAELLPPYTTEAGNLMTALRLDLAPEWKTYWRSPGDSGVPPQFDWTGATNLGRATPHWPRPEVIDSAGERTLGYHEALVLPIELTPAAPGEPVAGNLQVELGLCLNVCVPAQLSLALPPATDTPDPRTVAALAEMPQKVEAALNCDLTEIADGVQVAASVERTGDEGTAAALELASPEVWVSAPELTAGDGRLTAVADFVPPSAKPFPLDPSEVRLTLIGPEGAVEYQGCDPA